MIAGARRSPSRSPRRTRADGRWTPLPRTPATSRPTSPTRTICAQAAGRVLGTADPLLRASSCDHREGVSRADRNRAARRTRLVMEKPFGSDADSAAALNDLVTRLVPEDHVHRVDHFVAMPTVLNILGVRFANRMVEPMLNSQHVESVDVVFDESLALEGQGRLLRHHRRDGRHDPEPPARGDGAVRDGDRADPGGGGRARRQGAGPAGDPDLERRSGHLQPSRALHRGRDRRPRGALATWTRRASTAPAAPRPSPSSCWPSTPGAGRACRFGCARARRSARLAPRSRSPSSHRSRYPSA